MRVRKLMVSAMAAVTVAAGLVMAGASPASADQVWNQSVGRASADAPCPTNTPAETAAGWSKWAPSYAKWANDGKGGFVCDRSITWAKDSPPPSSTPAAKLCVQGNSGQYLDFTTSSAIAPFALFAYADETCSGSPFEANYFWTVYAPTGGVEAQTLCNGVVNGTVAQYAGYGADPAVYVCLDN